MKSNDVSAVLGLPESYLSWIVLRHFLPADLLRCLCHALVSEVSEHTLEFEQVAREVATPSDWSGAWMFEPVESPPPLAAVLWSRMRTIVWQQDLQLPPNQGQSGHQPRLANLEKAIRLSTIDLSASADAVDSLRVASDHRYAALIQSIHLVRDRASSDALSKSLEALRGHLSKLEPLLQTVAFKHLGDLCADADAWNDALILYREADAVNQRTSGGAEEFSSTLRSIIHQSIGTALWITDGAKTAFDSLDASARLLSFPTSPLFHANATHDILVASHEASPGSFATDRRASLALPPLLQSTHDGLPAMRSWIDEPSNDTPRLFWAALRRLIALGSTTQSRILKAYYGRSLVDGLDREFAGGRRAGDLFELAVRLLIESTEVKQVKASRWTQRVVRMYVDAVTVAQAMRIADRYPAMQERRRAVAVELFAAWLKLAGPEQEAIAPALLAPIIETVRTGEMAGLLSSNHVGRCLEILLELATERFELVRCATDDIARAVAAKIAPGVFWSAVEKAIHVATAFANEFRQKDLAAITDQVLAIARVFNLASSPISHAVLNFLYAEPVAEYLKESPERARAAVELVLDSNDGLVQTMGVLQFLKRFDAALFQDPAIAARLDEPVRNLRQSAQRTNSSATPDAIATLLSVPSVSGAEGVRDALDGMAAILKHAGSKQGTFLLPYAYQPLILLSLHWTEIADATQMPRGYLRERSLALIDAVVDVWRAAVSTPEVFASFSIPQSDLPNPTLVHNWTIASLSIARSFDREALMDGVIGQAADHSLLRDAIAEGRRTFSRIEAQGSVVPIQLNQDDKVTFYGALSEHLGRATALAEEQANAIYARLLEGCLKFGPREIDAAVLVHCVAHPDGLPRLASLWEAYLDRLAQSDLRPVLAPLVTRLGQALPAQVPGPSSLAASADSQ